MVKLLQSKCKNAKIYFRILPMEKICWENVKILDDEKTIYVKCRQDFVNKETSEPSYWSFETDGIFYNNSQAEIYESVASNLLENVTKGQNAVILCFGQTGTGKSLTANGIENSYEDRGIIPRLISDLFIMKNESKPKFKMCFQLSYIEATRVYIRDLLREDETLLDMNNIKEVITTKCENEQQMLKIIFKAEGRKSLAKQTQYTSHVANTVLTITVISKLVSDSSVIKTFSKIHIVDLAGADTAGNETCLTKNIFDIGTANLAKMQLEQFLLILIENIPGHIAASQRLNVLIQYLKDSLNTNSYLRFIGHVRIEKENLLITLSMLRFGQIVRGLKMKKLQFNGYEDGETKLKGLQVELKELKQDQEIDSMIRNEDLRVNIDQRRLEHMKTLAEEYLHDKTNELAVISVSDVHTVLQVFKNMFLALENERAAVIETTYKKAYDDAIATLRLSSKSNSSHKGSRRGSLKSKESVPTSSTLTRPKANKKTSKTGSSKGSTDANSIGDRSLLLDDSFNKEKSKDLLSIERPLRRSKTTTKGVKKSTSSRRRSSAASDIQKDVIVEDILALPKALPDYNDAWKSFIVNDGFYNELSSQMDEYESQARELNNRYVSEIKKLQEMRDWQTDCKDRLMRVKAQEQLNGNQEFDENGDPIVSEQEVICKHMIDNCENQVVQQQEKILGIRAELQLYLQLYQDKRKAINDNFENFCNKNFKTLTMSCETYSQETELDVVNPRRTSESLLKDEVVEKDVDTADTTQERQFLQYENLKSLMYKQRERMLHEQLLNKKWIRSCKND